MQTILFRCRSGDRPCRDPCARTYSSHAGSFLVVVLKMGKAPIHPVLIVQHSTSRAGVESRSRARLQTVGVLAIAAVAAYALLRASPSPHASSTQTTIVEPADEWQDNVWPMRDPTPWDISTDFPKPRKLEYEVRPRTHGSHMRGSSQRAHRSPKARGCAWTCTRAPAR